MWVPCQIWVHPLACFWIQAGFKSGRNSCGSSLLPLLGPRSFFSPHFLSLLHLLLCFSLSRSQPLQSPYTALCFSLFITLGQTPTPVLINSPSHRLFQLISAITHSIIRMDSPKVVDLERELAYLWFAAVWGLCRYVGCGDLWVWRYRGLRRYGVVTVWGLCRYLGGGGLVTVGGYGLNVLFHVNVMVLMWSLSGEIRKLVSTR